jgi:hypothetical protein
MTRNSDQTVAEMEELALRRSQALGKPVVVAGFTSSGEATVYDGDLVEDGELELHEVGQVKVTPTPPPGPPEQRPGDRVA